MLSVEETRRLDRLGIGPRAPVAAALTAGLRRARTPGGGLEFHDRRAYQAGDDPRSIDWNVDARFRQLVVRMFNADAGVRLHLLLDTSASMAVGTPPKLACAAKLAAVLAYVASDRRDAVGLTTFDGTIRRHLPCAIGRLQLFRVISSLSALSASGRSTIDAALRDYAGIARGPGFAIVISDFYGVAESLEGIRCLLYRGLTPALVQVVADEELTPDIDGEVELVDIEDPAARPVVVDQSAVAAYATRMHELHDRLRGFCRLNGIPWLRLTTSTNFESLLGGCLESGLLSAIA